MTKMKSKLARFLDSLFLTIVIWLFSAVIAMYYISETYLVVLTATTVSMGIGFMLNLRRKTTDQKERESVQAGLCAQHFMFHDDLYALDYFYTALRKRYSVDKSRFFLTINSTMIVPFVTEALTLKKAVFFYCEAVRRGAKTLVILGFKSEVFPVDLKSKLSDIRLEIFEANKTYRLLKSLNSLPKTEKPLKSRKIKDFLAAALKAERAKGYLTASLIMIFGAYFSIFSIYYIAAAAVCLTLALLCKLNISERLKKHTA